VLTVPPAVPVRAYFRNQKAISHAISIRRVEFAMIDAGSLLLFMMASVVLIATPGPDMLLMIVRTLSGGPRDGVLVTLGLIGGIILHTCLVAFGLAALFEASSAAFNIVKWAGAAYLVWLGVQAVREPLAPLDVRAEARRYSAAELLQQGFLSNALNPKVALFFLTFLPQFADGKQAPVILQLLLLGGLFGAMGLASYVALSFALGQARGLLVGGVRRILTRLSGGLMIALGVRLAFTER
jgi:threonine/homoserine/homoserine lactone efflux protein